MSATHTSHTVTLEPDAEQPKNPERYEAAIKHVEDKGGVIEDRFKFGFSFSLPNDNVSVASTIMEHPDFKTIESSDGTYKTQ
ncbi:hypothetical protein BCIN_12g01010 [Botrytis cinerea B05.10]|uniref:Inhibitor I9 domain-containing protein n=1 Tax=Botryotinia fuckeliana (strain B05.10) TaxID=332648 RepID=A0A384JY52_BOTFB|nr:hypothetical protein BCIN_12g01010 [Botrytis cinerea B05.10]ATZ55510.1 hypothetical protein BCIN_12g01010 [Botrytis cinerea B05.10]